MTKSLRFFILAAVLVGSNAFAPNTIQQRSQVAKGALRSSIHHDDQDMNDEIDLLEVPSLALKMAGILTIKTAKDVVNYPPQLFDNLVRQSSGVDQMNPAVMIAKLMGVLLFKTVHDAVYFPMVWTQRMVECQSLDECEVE